MRRFLTLIALVLLAPVPALGLLGPTKGSQLVTLEASAPCPYTARANARVLNTVVGPDGSTQPLVIPPKRLLVLTDASLSAANQPAGDVMAFQLLVGAPGTTGELVDFRFEDVRSSGIATIAFPESNGIPVRAGSVVCVDAANLTHGGSVVFIGVGHGYLAPDK